MTPYYYFKNYNKKTLVIVTNPSGLKISKAELYPDERVPVTSAASRSGVYENQHTPRPWTWAWTTDDGPFEIWRGRALYLRLDKSQLSLFSPRRLLSWMDPTELKVTTEFTQLYLGKTSRATCGMYGTSKEGRKVVLTMDPQPYNDALFNVTYDGICEDEDFFPHLLMGRELSARLKVPFKEEIQWKG